MQTLQWITCDRNTAWCALEMVDLSRVNVSGVYIIWHEGKPGRVVRVGQGDIAERLSAHRRDAAVLRYRQNGTLRVTWAAVPAAQLNGVERYLADWLKPLVGGGFPIAAPIPFQFPPAS